MKSPSGTEIAAVTRPWMSVPWIACTAPPPTSVALIFRCERVHQPAEVRSEKPCEATVQRIHASGIIARTKAPHITAVAMASLSRRLAAPGVSSEYAVTLASSPADRRERVAPIDVVVIR